MVSLVLAAAVMGVSSIAAKLVYERGGAPGDLVAARWGVPSAVFLLALPRLLRAFAELRRAGAAWFPLVGGALLCAGSWAEFGALERLPAAVVIVLLVSAPAWSALLRWVLWRQPIGAGQACAIAAVIAGVALIAGPPDSSFDVLGLGMALATALSTAVLMPLVEHLAPVCPPRSTLPLAIVTAGAITLVLELVFAPSSLVGGTGDGETIALLLVVGAAAALWAVLVGAAMRAADAVTATTVLAAEPVFVGLLAFVALDEVLTPMELAGCAVTLGGVVIAMRITLSRSVDATTTV
jgi:drug/metabolite transporter (DMT)-like permease